jgi:hypothetical protein
MDDTTAMHKPDERADYLTRFREKGQSQALAWIHDMRPGGEAGMAWALGVADVVVHKFGRALQRPQPPLNLGVDLVLPWRTRWALFRRGRVSVSARAVVSSAGPAPLLGSTVALELDGRILDAKVALAPKFVAPEEPVGVQTAETAGEDGP